MRRTSVVHEHFTQDKATSRYVCHHDIRCKQLAGTNATTSLRAHLNSFHKRWEERPAPPAPQLSSSSDSPSSKKRCLRQTSLDDRAIRVLDNPALLPAIASLFARFSWAHQAIDSPEFKRVIDCARHSNTDEYDRRALKRTAMVKAQELRAELITNLQSYCRAFPITIAMDGWSNVNMVKVTNVVLLCGGRAWYWCSIVNSRNHNTAMWLRDALVEVMNGLRGRGLIFAGLVLDNEAVNGALFNLLTPAYPFLVHSPCAAHVLQLCVDHTLRLPIIMPLLTSMEALINRFRNNKAAKMKLLAHQEADGVKPLLVKRPCTTRWSSHLQAAERLVELQKWVDMVEPQPPSFWTELSSLINFLKPFQVATDVLQADTSTLLDTYKQFKHLQNHVNRLQPADFLFPSKAAITDAILDMWDKHINLDAVVICAHLSFDNDADLLFARQLDSAQEWFVRFATQYALYWNLADYTEQDQVSRAARYEWTSYLQKSGSGFEKLAGEVEVMKKVVPFEPKRVWLLRRAAAPIISHAAIAILSVAGSEAAVERTFSIQGLVHSDRRNRMNDATVEAEMFIRMNERLLDEERSSSSSGKGASRKRKQTPLLQPLAIDMEVNEQDDEPMPSVAALFHRPAPVEVAEDDVEVAAAAAAVVGVEVRAAVVELPVAPPVDQVEAFIKQFVLDEHVTAHYRWSPSRSQVLEGKAAGQNPPIIMHTELLKRRIKEYVAGVVEAEQQQEAVQLG